MSGPPPRSAAADFARPASLEPIMTRCPAIDRRRASPRPWSPVPPRMPITRPDNSEGSVTREPVASAVMRLILPDASETDVTGPAGHAAACGQVGHHDGYERRPGRRLARAAGANRVA